MGEKEKLQILQDYAQGKLITRTVIDQLGLDDYADLIITLSQHDLELPRLSASDDHVRRATEILQPLLRQHAP